MSELMTPDEIAAIEERQLSIHHVPPTICEMCSRNFEDNPCQWQVFETIHACGHYKLDSISQLARLKGKFNDPQYTKLDEEELENPFVTIYRELVRGDGLDKKVEDLELDIHSLLLSVDKKDKHIKRLGGVLPGGKHRHTT